MQHFTRDTTQVKAYCRVCGRLTMHRVDDRRLGPCLEHAAPAMSKRQERLLERLAAEREQGELEF